jgi:hypothetical protein
LFDNQQLNRERTGRFVSIWFRTRIQGIADSKPNNIVVQTNKAKNGLEAVTF